jgi:hypothetical protein
MTHRLLACFVLCASAASARLAKPRERELGIAEKIGGEVAVK